MREDFAAKRLSHVLFVVSINAVRAKQDLSHTWDPYQTLVPPILSDYCDIL